MTWWLRSSLALACSLAVGVGAVAGFAAPAAATPPVSFAYGAGAPAGLLIAGPAGLAEATQTTVMNNVNINGLLATGITTDTAGPASAYAKVTYPLASTSWTVGLTTYTLSLSANQIASACTFSPLAASASINSGVLTETSQSGATVTSQVFNLPHLPATGQSYSYHGATVTLNHELPVFGSVTTTAISVTTPAQTLLIAVTGCGEPGQCMARPHGAPIALTGLLLASEPAALLATGCVMDTGLARQRATLRPGEGRAAGGPRPVGAIT